MENISCQLSQHDGTEVAGGIGKPKCISLSTISGTRSKTASLQGQTLGGAFAFFFPSCASVALARSSHIVVLMNELCRCNCYVPHWGVESGVRTITQSEV